jgi:hypothetical protein
MSNGWDGGCLCGAVRFRASGAPIWTAWCHCQSCRKHSGAPVSVFVAFKEADVEITKGEINRFRSSPRTVRGFCSTCGSTLTCQGDVRPGELHVHVGAFDAAPELAPAFHIFPEERLPWLCLAEANPA